MLVVSQVSDKAHGPFVKKGGDVKIVLVNLVLALVKGWIKGVG